MMLLCCVMVFLNALKWLQHNGFLLFVKRKERPCGSSDAGASFVLIPFSFGSALLNCRWSLARSFLLSTDDLFLCFKRIYDVSFIVPHPFGCFLCCSLYNPPFLFFDWSVKYVKTYKNIMEYKI